MPHAPTLHFKNLNFHNWNLNLWVKNLGLLHLKNEGGRLWYNYKAGGGGGKINLGEDKLKL